MSREIKFRVYDQTSKDYTVYGIGEVVDEHFGLGIISRIVWWLRGIKHKFIIEQYTGLIDKNSKEIYDGDIVEYDWYIYGDKPAYRTKGQVVFDDMGARVGNDRIRNCSNVEIIGNIHENPELLEN